jgi:hypothetical protein
MKKYGFRMGRGALIGAGVFLAPVAFGQIVFGRLSDFQDGTVQGWGGDPGQISNQPNGMGGASDRFLQVNSDGGFGPGSVPATFNQDLGWRGNYLTAGVTAIRANVRNQGPQSLSLRLVLFGTNGDRWTSTNPIVLAAGSGWQTLQFSLASGQMSLAAGSGTYNATITDVAKIMFRHQVGPPSAGGTPMLGQMGLDNIRAVPEPATILALAGGVAVLIRRRRK